MVSLSGKQQPTVRFSVRALARPGVIVLALVCLLFLAGSGLNLAQAQDPEPPMPRPSGVTEFGSAEVGPTGESRARLLGVINGNIRVNQDGAGGSAQNETTIAINPANSQNLVGGANDYRTGTSMCGFYSSLDGGRTWTDGTLPLVGGSVGGVSNVRSGDPAVTIGRDGTVYYGCMMISNAAPNNELSQYVFKSIDGGQTWLGPVRAGPDNRNTGQRDDKNYIAVDNVPGSPYSDRVYVTWTRLNTGHVFLSRSTDKASTNFDGTAQQISDAGNTGSGSVPAVGPGGVVYVAWQSGNTIRLDKSTDGGATWGTDVLVQNITSIGGGIAPLQRVNSFPSLGVDISGGPNDGNVYIVYASDPDGNTAVGDDSDIFFTRSSDGGGTWSTPRRLNDDVGTNSQFFPWLSVDPVLGTIHVMWYDARDDVANDLVHVYYTKSTDGGLSWSMNRRITTAQSQPDNNANFGPPPNDFFGDYNGIAAYNGFAYPFWTDTRNFNAEDVFIAILAPDADLSINKSASPSPAKAGNQLIYTITVSNSGPGPAPNVVVTDTLPISVTYVTDTDSCVEGPSGTLVCSLGDIPANDSTSFEIKVAVDSDAALAGPTTITNTAETRSENEPDPNLANNSVTLGTIVEDSADLKITKVGKPDDEVRAGENLTYTIFVDNLGPSDARSVVVTDTILSSGSYTLVTDPPVPSQGSCSVAGNTITCELGNLAADGRATIEIIVTAEETQDINNLVSVTADTPDPDHSNNQTIVMTAITDVADLEITKTDTPDPVVAGQTLSFDLDITNNGPSTAENVVVEDFLPRGVTVVTATPGQGSCTTGTPGDPFAPVVCNLGTMANAASVHIDLDVVVDPDYPVDPMTGVGSLENDAVVSSDIFDPDIGDNRASTITTVNASADLGITKENYWLPWPGPPNPAALAGALFTYEVTVVNSGPSTARNVKVMDQLPPGQVEYVSSTGNCVQTVPNRELECSLGDIEPLGIRHFFITVRANSDLEDGIEITNTMTALSDTPDPNGANDEFDLQTLVLTQADVEIQKTSEPDKVYAGEQKMYTIWAHNIGPSDALTVTVTDTLPISVTYEIDTDNCTLVSTNPDVLECSLGMLKPSEAREFEIWARVDPATPPDTVLVNEACVVGETTLGDPNPDNDCATARNLVLGKADLKITKFGKPDGQVRAGENLTYTVIVDNLGPGYAHNVVLTDVIQSSGVFTLVSVTSDRIATCTPDPATLPQQYTEQLQLRCELQDPLEVMTPDASGRWIVTIVVTADETQDINNAAHVLSSDYDPDTSNNQAFVEHDITDVSDLEITKTEVGEVQVDGQPGGTVTLIADQVTAGRSLTYTLTITNYGPSTAENVVLQDRLPPWIVVTGATPSQGSCDTGTPGEPLDKLSCGLGTLAPGASVTVIVTADVPSWVPDGTILEDDALVYSDIFDPTNANNFATNLTTVSAWADLGVVKADNPDPVVAGEMLNYTITVTNTGPSDAQNVVVDDVLPNVALNDPLVTYISDTDACYQDPIDRAKLTCSLGDIPAGGSTSFDILVQVNPDVVDRGFNSITDSVTVSSDTADPYTTNNSDAEDTAVQEEADLFITKVDVPAEGRLDEPFEPDEAVAGEEHRYLITFGNDGPSVARNVVVTDTLDLKQAGILGETFVRCEPVDPDDEVTCSEAGGIVSLDQLKVTNQTIIPGDLDPGDEYSFWLITKVDPGYVLDADDLIAEDTAWVSSDTPDPNTANNQDTEQTKIIAEADLSVEKVDDAAGFLTCDPVVAGGTITYDITVTNNGPSDAAQVYVVDWLPPEGLVLDPTRVTVQVSNGQVVEVRDDGRITVILGNDLNNEGNPELGRMNAGSTETVRIIVQVGLDASPGVLVDRVQVETRRNDTLWPPAPDAPAPGIDGGPRTPTSDPDLTNNTDTEETTVVAPAVTIHKTVSLDGTCPGTENVALGFPYQPVTFCYEVVNTGDTYLDNIVVTDTVYTPFGPDVYTFPPITYVSDPNVPVAPGESKMLSRTLTIDCNDRPDVATVTAEPVNRGRTRLACVPVVSDEDPAFVEAPCKGVDWRLQLPALDTDTCDTWLQLQNVGNEFTKAAIVIWSDPGPCEPQSKGPLKVECTGLLRPGSAWTFTNNLLPSGAKSAIVYSLNATDVVENWRGNQLLFADLACKVLGRSIVGNEEEWQFFDYAFRTRGIYSAPPEFPGIVESIDSLDFGAHPGESLAVVVDRTCPGDNDPNVKVNASYVGISMDREGLYDPVQGGYAYYAPLVWATHGAPPADMNSIIHIQNSGDQCASVEIWLQAQDDCIRPIIGDILSLAPGEAYQFDPSTVVPTNWQGSAWIASSQPLGIVVDLVGRDLFGAYHGVPADVYALNFTQGTLVNYAPLVYREYNGWETGIQVQNLSSTANAKVKVYFLDDSGDVITTITDWICPRGSQTFFLPVINGLPGNYVGSARIESQDWWSPGDPPMPAPMVLSVVNIIKYGGVMGPSLEMVTYNALQERGSFGWQTGETYPGVGTLGVPLVAKSNRGLTTELAIQNLNPNPGFTDFVLYIYDQNRLLDVVCEKLNEKQVEYINFDSWGFVRPGFLGSIVISATHSQQQGGAALGAVAVERLRRTLSEPDIPGDESKAFEAFPLYNRFLVEEQPECPGQP